MAIRKARESMVGDDEPLNSERDCKVVDLGTLYVCVTKFGEKMHSLKKGDTVAVRTHPDRIEIKPHNAREPSGGDDEPPTRSVVMFGRSLFVSVTEYGRKMHSLKKGDAVTVHTYTDRIEIEPGGGESNGE